MHLASVSIAALAMLGVLACASANAASPGAAGASLARDTGTNAARPAVPAPASATSATGAPTPAPASAPASAPAPASASASATSATGAPTPAPAPASASAPATSATGAPIRAAAAQGPVRALTHRKCTAWAGQAPKTSHDMVFRRDRLVRRATEEMEATYQLWDVDDTLPPPQADDACRAKARGFCAANVAAPGLCRFQVHEGLISGGWAAAVPIDSPPIPPKRRPKGQPRLTSKRPQPH